MSKNGMLESIDRIARVEEQLLVEYGRKPTLDEIAEEMDVEVNTVVGITNIKNSIERLITLINLSLETIEFFIDQCKRTENAEQLRSMNHRINMEFDTYDELNLALTELTN
jgi:DNA-directed RNA polymerase sigma subunit (sigma70/sigma32)